MNVRGLRSLVGASALVVASAFAVGCGSDPSPKHIEITSREDAFKTPELKDDPSIVEGDLLVVEIQSFDDEDEPMDLCPAASSSNPDVVELRAVRDKCRLFIVLARKPGSSTLSFRVRNTVATAEVIVSPSR